ncbi:hypothetical protein [Neomoorella thermoacetica]|nr:hypothetical protein [Moorella thermoacetica]OIQ61673.1 hypothetical protein MTIN_12540 [Moorella thermoacetica]
MPRRFRLSRNGSNQDRRSKVRARELHRIRGNQITIDPERGPENK